MRLLIVDSDTATARSIARELEKSFHHVLVAGCVREARFAIEQEDVEGGDKPGQWNASDLLSVAV
jgi:DNA-binding response OmpR family regulator